MSGLDDVLVVTVRKSFWASPEAERWPRRLYASVFYGHSTNFVNSLHVFVRALAAIWLQPPKVVLIGSVERTVPWFIRVRRLGLLRGAKLIVTNQLYLSRDQLGQVDRVIVYARAQAAALGTKGVFLPLPADGDFDAARDAAEQGSYVFAGGGAGRDFRSLIEAVRGSDVRLEIITFSSETLGVDQPIPTNVRVRFGMTQEAFLTNMAGAAVVVVPLVSRESPHGQTTLVQALAFQKPVVVTRAVSTSDYARDGARIFMVDAGDIAGYRRAIETALSLSEAGGDTSNGVDSYASFDQRLRLVCADVLGSRP